MPVCVAVRVALWVALRVALRVALWDALRVPLWVALRVAVWVAGGVAVAVVFAVDALPERDVPHATAVPSSKTHKRIAARLTFAG